MNKVLYYFLSFSLILVLGTFALFDNVYANNDYLYTTVTIPDGSPKVSTGSQSPGLTGNNTSYSILAFGYYNLYGTFKLGEKWRIESDYCVLYPDYNSFSVQGTYNLLLHKFNYKYGSTCSYTSSDGNVNIGTTVTFILDFTISGDGTQGFANIMFKKDDSNYSWFAFKNYNVYPSSEITEMENTQAIIDNQNLNASLITGSIIGSSQDIMANQNQNKQEIIDNQNVNTQREIDNANQNKQEIINNQNTNTQKQIDNQNKLIKGECTIKPSKNLFDGVLADGSYENTTGQVSSSLSTLRRNVNHINVKPNTTYIASNNGKGVAININQYRSDGTHIKGETVLANNSFTTTSETEYINIHRGSSDTDKLQIEEGSTITSYEPYGETEVCEGGLQGSVDDVNETMKDDNIDSSSASGFFSDFESSDHGLSSVITSPLRFIQNLTNNTCNSLSLNIPYVGKDFSLPCMSSIYQQHFGTLYTLYQTVTTGFIAYWVCVRVFALVKGFKDPENDKIEVMDL
ncbi:MAG: hypothetical protein PUB18_04095 [bacterium]|nr:hypothetical protein [bacterium]